MKGLVSIVIPAYNAEKYIAKTIQSVIDQIHTDWELIIVDDGSTDNTAPLIKSFLSDFRIKYIYQDNQGVSSARNKGISVSSGNFIALLDADDVWESNNIQLKLDKLGAENIDFIYSDAQLIGANNEVIQSCLKGNDQNILEHYLLWKDTVIPAPCSNLVIKKAVFKVSNIYFDPQFSTAADQDFCFRMSAKHNGKRIPDVTFSYRILSHSMSRNMKVFERDHLSVYKKASDLKLFKSFWFEQHCFSNLYMILAGSWWVNGQNKLRGLYYITRALAAYPPSFLSLLAKIFK